MGFFMSDEIKIETTDKTRRSAIKTAAQVAVTAPAVGLLLSATTKSAMAQAAYTRIGDDGKFIDDASLFHDDYSAGDDTAPTGDPSKQIG